MEGNPPPRVAETASGMLNAIGLQNPGVEGFIRDDLPAMRELEIPVIVNVLGETVREYAQVVERLEREPGIAAYELNISCPNVAAGGIAFGCEPSAAAHLVAAVRTVSRRPIIPKLTPNVADIVAVARACVDAGADALSLINTIKGMAIDIESRRPILANVTGGLSGPAIKPVALRMVWEVHRAVDVPLIGMGGIANARDAVEFILAGASAVAVGTASFVDPSTAVGVVDALPQIVARLGASSVRELVGALTTD
jgi:dihydroorotate dehydrogenase (NAD+) catalytic subunit